MGRYIFLIRFLSQVRFIEGDVINLDSSDKEFLRNHV